MLLSSSVSEAIDWFIVATNAKSAEGLVGAALSENKFIDSAVGTLFGSTDDVVWMIDVFVRDEEVAGE